MEIINPNMLDIENVENPGANCFALGCPPVCPVNCPWFGIGGGGGSGTCLGLPTYQSHEVCE